MRAELVAGPGGEDPLQPFGRLFDVRAGDEGGVEPARVPVRGAESSALVGRRTMLSSRGVAQPCRPAFRTRAVEPLR